MSSSRQLSPARADLPIVSSSFTEAMVSDLKAKALAHLNDVQGFVVTSDADAQLAAEGINDVAATKKLIDETRKAFLVPINAEHDRVHGPFKAAMDLCDSARKLLADPLGAYQLAKAQRQAAEMKAATVAAATGDATALTTALQGVAAAAPTKLKGVTVKAYWVAEVHAPDLVPHAFLCPDLERIQKHALNTPPEQEPTPIGGVRFRLETGTRITGKR